MPVATVIPFYHLRLHVLHLHSSQTLRESDQETRVWTRSHHFTRFNFLASKAMESPGI